MGMNLLTRNGTDGRVYGGDCDLVHIADGTRGEVGVWLSQKLDVKMRNEAYAQGKNNDGNLCPGCYMIALFNAAIQLAKDNGQPLTELSRSMANAFNKLGMDPSSGMTEEIAIILDPV